MAEQSTGCKVQPDLSTGLLFGGKTSQIARAMHFINVSGDLWKKFTVELTCPLCEWFCWLGNSRRASAPAMLRSTQRKTEISSLPTKPKRLKPLRYFSC